MRRQDKKISSLSDLIFDFIASFRLGYLLFDEMLVEFQALAKIFGVFEDNFVEKSLKFMESGIVIASVP